MLLLIDVYWDISTSVHEPMDQRGAKGKAERGGCGRAWNAPGLRASTRRSWSRTPGGIGRGGGERGPHRKGRASRTERAET